MVEDFEKAVAAHKDMVYSFAYHFLGNQQEAEDLTQEVLMRLWSHWETMQAEMVPRWLNRVTRNASYDLLRRRRVRRRFLVEQSAEEGAPELVERAISPRPDPLQTTVAADSSERLREALAGLSEPYRSAVILREMQELSYQEIAEVLQVPINTAKTHVHRGRRRLREVLSEVLGNVACQTTHV